MELTSIMLDIAGFFTSTEFLAQIAAVITAVLTALFNQLFAGFFAGV